MLTETWCFLRGFQKCLLILAQSITLWSHSVDTNGYVESVYHNLIDFLCHFSLSHTHIHITRCFKMFYLPPFDVLLLIGFSSSLCSSLSCICTLMLCLIQMRWTHSRCEKRKPDSKSAFLAVYGLFNVVPVKQTPKSLLKTVKKTMHTWIGDKCIHLYHVFIFRGKIEFIKKSTEKV